MSVARVEQVVTEEGKEVEEDVQIGTVVGQVMAGDSPPPSILGSCFGSTFIPTSGLIWRMMGEK